MKSYLSKEDIGYSGCVLSVLIFIYLLCYVKLEPVLYTGFLYLLDISVGLFFAGFSAAGLKGGLLFFTPFFGAILLLFYLSAF
ncbi:hypothetical protein [Ammoniphilus resinae]|uniref:Uncharacterized protein n=1 Tax=Ammoniphilus resinae TaxID=861532 RepID=A0ABS4GRS8_9BACL|nr:hypothetical protein [Ammoniphilus resinae]MBP1932971.1 hypothetical protein [Ammoniphilus resinae]